MYDVLVIGCGVSSLFMAYEMVKTNPDLKIKILEKGRDLQERKCPMEKSGSGCVSCVRCAKHFGFGGLARSEGKYNYTNDFGGALGEKIGNEKALVLMEEADAAISSFVKNPKETYSTGNDKLKEKARKCGLDLLESKVRHIGRRASDEFLKNIRAYLEGKVEFEFGFEAKRIEYDGKRYEIFSDSESVRAEKVVLATGSSEDMRKLTEGLDIASGGSRMDIGIRIEMKKSQFQEMLKDSFEVKLSFDGEETFGYTYCMNPGGRVVKKQDMGLFMADGENYRESGKTDNINFTFFVPKYFASQQEARRYAVDMISKINAGKERIAVQRLEDLVKKQATGDLDLVGNSVHMTLEASGANLWGEIPKIYIESLMEFFKRLERLIGEKIDPDTLLYGVDMKTYCQRFETDIYFETSSRGLFICGDCSGETWSLSQAAASGIWTGRRIGMTWVKD